MLVRLFLVLSAVSLASACGAEDDGSTPEKTEISVPDAGGDQEMGLDAESDIEPDIPPRDTSEVTERGPYHVGYRSVAFSYLPDGAGRRRSIGAGIWYPTRDTEGTPASYLVPRDDVFVGASVLDAGNLPVVIFSHGSGGYAEQSFFWTEYLASHGFVVAAPTHTGNTFAATTIPFSTLADRPRDVSVTLDELYADEELGPHLSNDDVAVAGHSFGGYTAFAVVGAKFNLEMMRANCNRVPSLDFCDELTEEVEARFDTGFRDPRFKLAIPMAPFGAYLIYGDGAQQVDVPVLLLTASMDESLPNWAEGDRFWASLDGPDDRRVDIEGAGHFTFSNVCELPIDMGSGDGCGPDNIDPAVAHDAINAYSLAFIRRHLWGDEADLDLLDGQRSLLDAAILSMP